MGDIWKDPFGIQLIKNKKKTVIKSSKKKKPEKKKPEKKEAPPPANPCCHNCHSLPCICLRPVMMQQYMYIPGPSVQTMPVAKPQPPPPAKEEKKKPSHKCVNACTAEKKCAACKKVEESKKEYYVVPNFQNPRQTYREHLIAGKIHPSK